MKRAGVNERVGVIGRGGVREIGVEEVSDEVRESVMRGERRGERRALGKREEVCV